jgi:hypothetical protein
MKEIDATGLTPRAQQMLALARREAERLGHNFIGTEHLLLGLLKLQEGEACKVLKEMGLEFETTRCQVEDMVGDVICQKAIGEIPYTPRSKKVLAHANVITGNLKYTYVNTESILLALLQEGGGVAARVLHNNGIDFNRTREEILKKLDPNYSKTERTRDDQDKKVGEDKTEKKSRLDMLGDQLVAKMYKIVSNFSGKGCPFNAEDEVATFFCLDLLLAGDYTFGNITLEVILALNRSAKTVRRLDIVYNIIRRRWTDGEYTGIIDTIQDLYNNTNHDSAEEIQMGSLLQKLTDKHPRKIGPERDMMSLRPFITDENTGDICPEKDPIQIPQTPLPAPPPTT